MDHDSYILVNWLLKNENNNQIFTIDSFKDYVRNFGFDNVVFTESDQCEFFDAHSKDISLALGDSTPSEFFIDACNQKMSDLIQCSDRFKVCIVRKYLDLVLGKF